MPYNSVDLTTLRTRLKERYDSVPFWTDDEARRALNETLRVWNAITGFWRQRVNATANMNDPYVTLDGTMVHRTRVELNNVPLDPTSVFELDCVHPNWRGETVASGGSVPTTPVLWAPISMTLFVIWPASDVVQSNAIQVDGVRATPILVNAGDFVDIGEEEFSTLLGYAVHRLTLKLGGPRFQATMPLYKQFLAAAAERNDHFAASSFYRRVMGLDTHRIWVPVMVPTQVRTPALEGGD